MRDLGEEVDRLVGNARYVGGSYDHPAAYKALSLLLDYLATPPRLFGPRGRPPTSSPATAAAGGRCNRSGT